MPLIEDTLRKLAAVQEKYPVLILLIVLIFTAVMAFGSLRMELDPSYDSMIPDDAEVIRMQDVVSTEFGSTETMLILVELDPSSDDPHAVSDIRDPRVAEYVEILSDSIASEKNVKAVYSLSYALNLANSGEIPETEKQIGTIIENSERVRMFVNSEYSSTLMFIPVDICGDVDVQEELEHEINRDIADCPKPVGIKTNITGMPSVRNYIMILLSSDLINTIAVSMIFVFIILWYLLKHPITAAISLIPVFLGVIWISGTMGYLGIKLSSMTVGLGAMLVGMGIDYGIHVTHRFFELVKRGEDFALQDSVVSIGTALVASVATTMAGFAALMGGTMPVNRDMGFLLTIGIFYAFMATMIALPPLLAMERKYLYSTFDHLIFKITRDTGVYKESIPQRVLGMVARFQAKAPALVIIIALVFTVMIIPGVSKVRTDFSDENFIPEGSDVMKVMGRAASDYAGMDSITFLVRLNHNDCVSDLSDPAVLRSTHVLASLINTIEYVDSVDSVTMEIKDVNDGYLPRTIEMSKKILEEQPQLRSRFNSDYSYMTFEAKGSFDDSEVPEFEREIESVRFPDGVDVSLVGMAAKVATLRDSMGKDLGLTAMLGFILVFFIASFIYRSPTAGVLVLLPIVFALVWAFSTMGHIDLPFTPLSTGVLSMVMGVGIDFSIHLYHRIKQELEAGNSIEESVCIAVPSVGDALFASTTTTIVCFMVLTLTAALLVVNRLGATLAIGVGYSFVAAMWMVPAIVVLEEKFKDRFIRSRSLGG
uniref:Protein-export membrane protein SecF n=1 Tax=Candidatus Methanogaster sp. ANME-2c ERB4 TaxID=2759911 RepID=A0A7G9Y6N2_9EURY|nr:protein-export membrane protein SecF [Methanosarcinales archaeon ANME-2c ERB4]QNO43979.1 protein-export membrane protein SecF [Methanosarcinales archaeon ANME-2c ERB4]QNO50623.1 protein-export membrane protein SecF [Methanosarcinales archaeon ANME-2c ERB4]